MRLITRFALDLGETFEIIDVFDTKTEKTVLEKENPVVETLTTTYPSAIWMERKIADEFGITFQNAFDTRALVKQERFAKDIFPLRKDFTKTDIEFSETQPYVYEEIKGDSTFVISVGPIHAGIIEPGHFQFSQAGEEILHLEVRHFYKYRGIEKMCEGKEPLAIQKIIERISGNESVAYQIAFFDILAQASCQQIPTSLQRKHAILLELERIAHHLTDLGFIPNDAGFGSALSFMGKLSEDTRRVLHTLTGHRFGFGAISGDVTLDYTILRPYLSSLQKEMEFFQNWIEDIPSLWDRFETTGGLSQQKAIKYGVVGVGARASGIRLDRRDNAFYKQYGFKMQLGEKGEVGDRFNVRIQEVFHSIQLIENLITDKKETMEFDSFNDGEYMSFVESSLGELFLFTKIKDNTIERLYVRDPSHINWQAFHTTIYKDIIADFPLINKSFDLSYAGNDL